MSISKIKGSTTTIIRRPDYARKDIEGVSEVEISNKDSKLDNNFFKDLVMEKRENSKQDKQHKKDKNSENKKNSNTSSITDLYV